VERKRFGCAAVCILLAAIILAVPSLWLLGRIKDLSGCAAMEKACSEMLHDAEEIKASYGAAEYILRFSYDGLTPDAARDTVSHVVYALERKLNRTVAKPDWYLQPIPDAREYRNSFSTSVKILADVNGDGEYDVMLDPWFCAPNGYSSGIKALNADALTDEWLELL